jgi:hypothetical protein
MMRGRVLAQGSILQNSISAENFSDEFSPSTKFRTKFHPKKDIYLLLYAWINFHPQILDKNPPKTHI